MFSQVILFFKENGYRISSEINSARTLVFNTCAFTDRTIIEQEGALQRFIKQYNNKKFIIFGCLTELSNKFHKINNTLLIEPKKIHILDEYFRKTKSIDKIYPHRLLGFSNYQTNLTDNDYFVHICQGCVNDCSYCNIKKAKGYVTSKSINTISEEVKNAIKSGIFSVALLADDCGSYGVDIQTNIVELIDRLLKIHNRLTLKIYSIHPYLLINYYHLLKKFIKSNRITYICLPCQSGSQRIINLMNRKYDINRVKKIVKDIKKISPEIHLCTHIMYNFPTESKEDFKESLKLAREFDFIIFLEFGETKKTPSAKILPKSSNKDGQYKERIIRDYIDNKIITGKIAWCPEGRK